MRVTLEMRMLTKTNERLLNDVELNSNVDRVVQRDTILEGIIDELMFIQLKNLSRPLEI